MSGPIDDLPRWALDLMMRSALEQGRLAQLYGSVVERVCSISKSPGDDSAERLFRAAALEFGNFFHGTVRGAFLYVDVWLTAAHRANSRLSTAVESQFKSEPGNGVGG